MDLLQPSEKPHKIIHMHLKNILRAQFKKFISLVYQNYQGQVAIFVALIFQIVFILFALMINVGLLVHHKINLQQSADLAAYYGAMKQAEMLNVVSHVNFQIRQAFKLLTWRYRVLGTFGFEQATQGSNPVNAITFPIQLTTPPQTPPIFKYNSASENFTCDVGGISLRPTDIPFMCMSHYGFKEFPNPQNYTETYCKVDCTHFKNLPTEIKNLTMTDPGGTGIWGSGAINAINNAITQANLQVNQVCKATGPTTLVQLVKFYVNYLQDTKNKMLFIKMLMANLSAREGEMLDIDGKKVFAGSKLTFQNNLTEANNTSLINDTENIFETYNSLSPDHGGECSYPSVASGSPSISGNAKLFAEINFKYIQYFITKCQVIGSGDAGLNRFSSGSIYGVSGGTELETILKQQLTELYQTAANQIEETMTHNFYDHTVGIEKNPWCQVYYGVKASTTPVIPFLPISKITLHASAFAKPFGGSIGPRSFNEWPKSAQRSIGSGGQATQVDRNLPMRDPLETNLESIKDNRKTLLNYSNYVGDTQGLSDPKYLAVYYDMLLNRNVGTGNTQLTPTSFSKDIEPAEQKRGNPVRWPAYSEWNGLTEAITSPKYDALAYDTENNKNSFMRDIELSVVAPNQFDATYYSIEPDFYNVYVKNRLEKSIGALSQQAGLGAPPSIPKDFGANNNIQGVGKNFSVRNQLEVVQRIMRANPSAPPSRSTFSFAGRHAQNMSQVSDMYFSFIPYLPGSLLTSWTMKDFVSDDYSQVTQDETKMPFAKCLDEDLHGSGYGSISDTQNPNGDTALPPTPGNCITGGRTGYSVKLVNPAALFSSDFSVGNATDSIINPPSGFVSF